MKKSILGVVVALVFGMAYSDDSDYDEKPAHKVTVGSFYISKYPVTQKQWFDITGTTAKEQRDKANPQGPLAGGGGFYLPSWMSRVSIRDCYKPGDRFGGVGFRIVMEP